MRDYYRPEDLRRQAPESAIEALAQRLAERLCAHARGSQYLHLHVRRPISSYRWCHKNSLYGISYLNYDRDAAVQWVRLALLAGYVVYRQRTRSDYFGPGQVVARLNHSWIVLEQRLLQGQ